MGRKDKILLSSLGWLGTHYVDQVALKLKDPSIFTLECWDYKCAPCAALWFLINKDYFGGKKEKSPDVVSGLVL